jgi:hypothetical protein
MTFNLSLFIDKVTSNQIVETKQLLMQQHRTASFSELKHLLSYFWMKTDDSSTARLIQELQTHINLLNTTKLSLSMHIKLASAQCELACTAILARLPDTISLLPMTQILDQLREFDLHYSCAS